MMDTASKVSRHRDLGALHDLLLKACPPDENGRSSIPVLARALGISTTSLYNWITANRVPQRRVRKLVELSDGRVSSEDFLPYLLG